MKLTLLTLLTLAIIFFLLAQSNYHLDRNKHNLLPSGNLSHTEGDFFEDDSGRVWELLPQSKNIFHQPDQPLAKPTSPYPNVSIELDYDPNNPNLKFLSPDKKWASFEAILQPDGQYLVEGPKRGTYNYGHPDGLIGNMVHVVLDVIPHLINGNYKS